MTSKSEKAALKRERERAARLESITRNLLRSADGREYLYWILSIGGIAGNPFNPDPVLMAYNCGTRYVGETLQAHIIDLSPEAYALMLKEQADAVRRNLDDESDPAPDGNEPAGGDEH